MTYVTFRPNSLDQLTNELFRRINEDSKTAVRSTKTDIYKNDKSLVFEMELPGYSKTEINVSSKEDKLTITAEKKNDEKNEVKYIRKERLEGKIERSFIIPEAYDLSKTSAKFENGLLTITIEEYVKQEREIEISVK
ncbi:MAG: Hsp20/alpha crystallin family protein [Melioribacteraceae bacterium]|nr:Hsp20/alpha crystallin family protein [Melioribacteraceae bacterium]